MMKYDDIINMPHHRSKKHPPMPIIDRAAQFSPFAALTGHEAAIKETARLTDRKIELDEYEIATLDERLQQLRAKVKDFPEITVTYFQPDAKKAGGEYLTITDQVKKIDEYGKCLIMSEGTRIPIDEILELVIN